MSPEIDSMTGIYRILLQLEYALNIRQLTTRWWLINTHIIGDYFHNFCICKYMHGRNKIAIDLYQKNTGSKALILL